MNIKLKLFFSLIVLFFIIYNINGKAKKKEIILPENNYGIDYDNPEKYINSGTQSTITDEEFEIIKTELNIDKIDLKTIKQIHQWRRKNFKGVNAGGKTIGKNTINNILKTREVTGCHDDGLILVSLFRKFGVPAIFVDTAAIQWALDYPNTRGFFGHIFVEVFLDGKWILFDSNSGEYIENYNPLNPVIPITKRGIESKGYYVMFKGLDPKDYSLTGNDNLQHIMKVYAIQLKREIDNLDFPDYIIKRIYDYK